VTQPKRKIFWIVVGIHAGALLLLGIIPAIQSLIHPRPKEIIQFVEFVSEAAEVETAPTQPGQPLAELPVEKPKWEPAKVIRQNRRASQKPHPVTPPRKTITSSEIKKALNPTGTSNPFGAYYNTVRQRMYSVWEVPLASTYGLSAQASITVSPTGTVSNRQLIRSSGNSQFDQSVREALHRIQRLPTPPTGLPSRTITLLFEPQ